MQKPPKTPSHQFMRQVLGGSSETSVPAVTSWPPQAILVAQPQCYLHYITPLGVVNSIFSSAPSLLEPRPRHAQRLVCSTGVKAPYHGSYHAARWHSPRSRPAEASC